MAPDNLFVNAPILPAVAQEMGNVHPPAELAHDEQERNHVITVLHSPPADEGHTPPAGARPEHEMENVVPNHYANPYAIAPVEVAQDNEQGMENVVQHANSNVNPPIHVPPVEAEQSANVPPPTGEVQIQPPVQPAQDEQERDAIPPEDHTPPPANTRESTTNNQLSDRVGDGSHTPDSDRPTLDTEKHLVHVLKRDSARRHHSLPDNTLSMSWPQEEARFLFDEKQQAHATRFLFDEKQQAHAAVSTVKPRRGSRSSRDPGVHRRSKPPPSPLAHTPPRSAIKKRRISTSSIPYKRQSQAEDGEETMLLELPKTPKSSSPSSSRQSKSENDEERNLLKEQSPVDDEHLTLSDGRTSDDP